ncbi:MAG: hypothetical protein RLZZ502_1919 [Pseudomonadota bacterium]|jgi:hypothetical protein
MTHRLHLYIIIVIALLTRLLGLSEQVLLDDEYHAIHALQTKSYGAIYSSFGAFDYSIPLTLFWKFMHSWGLLDEWMMRWPFALAGLYLVYWVYHETNRYAPDYRYAVALVMALAPFLVFYSRTARPYMLTLVLSLVALKNVYSWGKKDLNWPVAYVLAGSMALWLHPVVAPTLAMAALWAFALRVRLEGLQAAVQASWLIALTMLALCALTLAPPMLLNPGAIGTKTGIGFPSWDTLIGSGFLLTGSSQLLISVAIFIAFIVGLKVLWSLFPAARNFVLAVLLTQILAALLARPDWLEHPQVFLRYNMLLVVVVVVAIGVGVGVVAHAGKIVYFLPLIFFPWLMTSPLFGYATSHYPTATWWQWDLREHYNPVRIGQEAVHPPQWLLENKEAIVAVAPWKFESFLSPMAQLHKYRNTALWPAQIGGYCLPATPQRYGEMASDGFPLRNAVHLANAESLSRRNISHIMLIKHFKFEGKNFIPEAGDCFLKLNAQHGEPVYQDERYAIFALPSTKAPTLR